MFSGFSIHSNSQRCLCEVTGTEIAVFETICVSQKSSFIAFIDVVQNTLSGSCKLNTTPIKDLHFPFRMSHVESVVSAPL